MTRVGATDRNTIGDIDYLMVPARRDENGLAWLFRSSNGVMRLNSRGLTNPLLNTYYMGLSFLPPLEYCLIDPSDVVNYLRPSVGGIAPQEIGYFGWEKVPLLNTSNIGGPRVRSIYRFGHSSVDTFHCDETWQSYKYLCAWE